MYLSSNCFTLLFLLKRTIEKQQNVSGYFSQDNKGMKEKEDSDGFFNKEVEERRKEIFMYENVLRHNRNRKTKMLLYQIAHFR